MYHVLNRGDRREPIFRDDRDRQAFLTTLGETCGKTGWEVPALCLMDNHFHLVEETPRAIWLKLIGQTFRHCKISVV
jgi:REP element-mobilizing transposase RayT